MSSQASAKSNRQGGLKQLSQQQNQQSLSNHFILTHPNIRVFCDCCRKNITLMTFIMADKNQYCVGCFAKFQQFPQTYHVYDRISYCLIDENWMTLDEILLLTGFQKWGFGNWGEVKDYMGYNGANFSKDELITHYDTYYLQNDSLFPQARESLIQSSQTDRHIRGIRKIEHQDKINETGNHEKFLQIKSQSLLNRSEGIPSIEALPKNKLQQKQPNILGYNPKRKSFFYELEYDDKAETLLSDLQFRDDDSIEQMELKFQIIENFNKRQEERLKRYKFTIDHHILDIDYRFKQQIEASKYQKEAFNSFRKFTRFQIHEENEYTKQLIAKNSYLKSMIHGLRRCRKKLDESGRISQTLEELRKKDTSLQKLGAPRKIVHIDSSQANNKEYSLLKQLQIALKSQTKKEINSPKPQITIIARNNTADS